MQPDWVVLRRNTGWQNDPVAAAAMVQEWDSVRGSSSRFESVASNLMEETADDAPALLHYAFKLVRGQLDPAWNQNPAGTCVGFGHTAGAETLLLWEIACGETEEDPGAHLAVEPTYAGSRVEIGGNRINGDGSVGVWAGEWAKRWGFVKRAVYGQYDLRQYSVPYCRQWGSTDSGVPAEIEAAAKLHPISDVALVTTAAEGWAALGAGKPIPVCSNAGFESPLDADGFCRQRGSWSHCMLGTGRFKHPRNGRSVVIRNSWADYLQVGWRKVEYIDTDGTTKQFDLPPGYFCTTLSVFGSMLAQRDSVTYAGFSGWKKQTIDNML